MSNFQNMPYRWRQVISYSSVAAISAALTAAVLIFFGNNNIVNYSGKVNYSQDLAKLEQIYGVIQEQYIGDADEETIIDAASLAMVMATGDQWSYYMTAEEYAEYQQKMSNTNSGIGVTINDGQMSKGLLVETVTPDSGAAKAGIQVGDWITHVEGEAISGMTLSNAQKKIRGQSGTAVKLTINRNGTSIDLEVTRGTALVARGQLLDDGVGLVTIYNFNQKCSDETIKIIEDLKSRGAKALIFDVRNNPGGSASEMSSLLDYLLPEGCILFRSEDNQGNKEEVRSDAHYLDMPIAVLMNENSYSAAELFAASIVEYEKGFTAGQHTTGKGRYQIDIPLNDGSAIHLSVGRYTTPKGVDLGEVGGLAPTFDVELTKDQAEKLASGLLDPEDDPQVQKAVEELLKKVK